MKTSLAMMMVIASVSMGCQKLLSVSDEVAQKQDPKINQEDPLDPAPDLSEMDEFDTITYYRGGWFGPIGRNNWSHSFTLNLKTGVLRVAVDPFECHTTRTISIDEIKKIKELYLAADVQLGHKAIQMIDAGYEYLTLKKIDPQTFEISNEKSISFDKSNLVLGEFYFSNPEKLSEKLQSLTLNIDGLPIACE